MALQIVFPGVLHRWLEGEPQHFEPTHFLGKLIGGKCLAESHFRVPKEMRSLAVVLLPETLDIVSRFVHRRLLFRAHLEIKRTTFLIHLSSLQSDDGRLDIFNGTLKPLAFRISNPDDSQ